MKNPMSPVRFAAALALLLGALAANLCPAQEPASPDAKKDERKPDHRSGATQLEPFKVTGSHIERVDYETPSPVATYTAAEIEDKGYATLGEFVSSLSFNNNQTNSEITTG